jgi:cytochrome bd ubiquinol oxidase subunit I
MLDFDPVSLSRLQFGMTALYHFLFVPLTLGLSFLLAIMESVYVMTGRPIWRDMTKFWGKLFGINFAMGVATGITMEFQFGTNWAYYSHYVGDIFGAPLAIEGLMAFFLESSFVGLFFFGWNRLSKTGHLAVTWLVAIGSNLSALWILIANGWMQNPVGAVFNPDTMRMELTSFWELMFNPVAQSKFVHTVSAGYVTGSVFMLSVSAYYLLKGRHLAFAKRSMIVASAFGLASALSVVVLGDESGYSVSEHQKMKLAAIEAMWETEAAPAGFTLFAIPDVKNRTNHAEVKIPWALGLIATRSTDTALPGIDDLVVKAQGRIRDGLIAYDALERLRVNRADAEARATLAAHADNLGHALLLKRYVADPRKADAATIAKAARDTVPGVGPLFWSFRVMVALGFFFIGLFAVAFWRSCRRNFNHPLFLKICLCALPLPWLAAELGWFVAEFGRQPWSIDGVLPTFLGVSSVSVGQVLFTLTGFVLFYSSLAVVDVVLMRKYVRMGPAEALRPGQSAASPMLAE